MLSSVCEELEKIRRSFYWGEIIDEETRVRKLYTISWEKLCLPKDSGGLNITLLRLRNGVMLAKWYWRLYLERGKWWNNIMVVLYGTNIKHDIFQIPCKAGMSPVMQSLINLKDWQGLKDQIQYNQFV